MSDHWQRGVEKFVEEYSMEAPVPQRLLDLLSELGELAKEELKRSDYGRVPSGRRSEEWNAELGDVLFSLICLANSTGVDLDGALAQTLEKYQRRMAERGTAGSG